MRNSILADNYLLKQNKIKTIPNRDIIVKVGAGIVDVPDDHEDSGKPMSTTAKIIIGIIVVSLVGGFFLIA